MTTESLPQPILLVEDNPVDLDLTRRAFRRRRLANPIEIARDGEEALAFMPRWDAGEALPAVIVPSEAKAGRNAPREASVVSALIPSSRSTSRGSPFRCGTLTG